MALNPWIVPLAVCMVGGALAGTAFGLSSQSDEPGEVAQPPVLVAESVAYYQCPEVGHLGDLHGGDRIYATARDESSSWVQVRAPFALDARVWVAGEALDPDRSFADLPVRPCEWEGPAADEILTQPPPSEPGPQPDSVPPEPDPDADSLPPEPEPEPEPRPLEPEPEPGPPPPGPEPEPVPEPVPPREPDRTPPAIVGLTADPRDIWEQGCISPVSVIRSQVEDDEGVANVVLFWSVGGASGSTPMHLDGGDFVTEIGNFAPRTVDPAGSGVAAIVLTIEATDAAGNTSTVENSEVLVLHLCD